MTKSRGILPARRPWSDAELAYLRENFPNTQTRLVAAALGRTESMVNGKAYQLGLAKTDEYLNSPAAGRLDGVRGASSRFQKGHATWNTGKKCPGLGGPTRFQKGHKGGSRAAPVGGYRINRDGYLEIKLNDDAGPYTVRWKPVHRLVWEQAHGPVPESHCVRFKPGQHTTDVALITLDRIECISQVENMLRNSCHRFGPEVAKVVQLRGALSRQINKRAKEAA